MFADSKIFFAHFQKKKKNLWTEMFETLSTFVRLCARSHTTVGSNWFSQFDVSWIQTDTQAKYIYIDEKHTVSLNCRIPIPRFYGSYLMEMLKLTIKLYLTLGFNY